MKSGLESYCYQMRQQLDDEKMRAHFTEKDRQSINGHTNEVLLWLSSRAAEEAAPNQFATKQRDLESKFNPIMMRVY
jgi:heat shock protein 1/8